MNPVFSRSLPNSASSSRSCIRLTLVNIRRIYYINAQLSTNNKDLFVNNSKLTTAEKKLLLKLARETINDYVRKGTIPQKEITAESLLTQQGCFVSIKIGGMLRGCIGNFTSDKPLFQLVKEMAVSTATRDPRFYPLKTDDLEDYVLEISVLSPCIRLPLLKKSRSGRMGYTWRRIFHAESCSRKWQSNTVGTGILFSSRPPLRLD